MNVFYRYLAAALLSAGSFHAAAQSVGIGTSTPHASAALDISSTGRGLLPPRLTYQQRTGISNAAAGLLVYQTDASTSPPAPAGYYYHTGTQWLPLAGQPDNLGNHTATQALNLNGQLLTGGGAQGLSVSSTGSVGIGNTAPQVPLEVTGDFRTTSGTTTTPTGAEQSLSPVGGSSVLNFTDNPLGQSFTLPVAAVVTSVGLSLDSPGGTSLTVSFLNGAGLGGTQVGSAQTFTVAPTGPGVRTYTLDTPPALAAGQPYTLRLSFGGGTAVRVVAGATIGGGAIHTGGSTLANYSLNGSIRYRSSTTAPTPVLASTGNRVGVGTAAPQAELHVAGAGSTVRLEGLAGAATRLVTADASGNLGTSGLGLTSSGYVGIGTSSPGVPLDVQTSVNAAVGGYAYLANVGPSPTGYNGGGTNAVSIRASARVVAAEFNATSDRRLKTLIGLSDRAADLALLQRLRITDYRMRDRAQFGDRRFKKVIAQEVEDVFPQAVNRQRGFLPDIYQVAKGLTALPGDSLLALAVPVPPAGAAPGQRLRLVLPDGRLLETAVAHAAAPGTAQLLVRRPAALAGALPAGLFVYGLEHPDVRTVDYEALAMLNVSATQELARQLAELQQQHAALQQHTTAAQAAAADLARRVQALEAQGQQARR
ncbi:hypothetical protein GCM10027048_23830 [Hymenobacter coalescens]